MSDIERGQVWSDDHSKWVVTNVRRRGSEIRVVMRGAFGGTKLHAPFRFGRDEFLARFRKEEG